MNEVELDGRIRNARVARLATVGIDRRPHIVPCCFAVRDEATIVSVVDGKPKSTGKLRRLANIAANPSVSLVVDHYDDDWSQLWWVRVDGQAHVLHEGSQYDSAIDELAAKYPQYVADRPTGALIVIEPTGVRSWAAT